MKCYYCGAELDQTTVCPECGEDVRIWKKVCGISNRLYNDGLEKAQLRDLSSAASSLRLSLKYNKANIPARNLLGLVYYETGDSVAALSEWVISQSMAEEDNPAVLYIERVRQNAKELADVNQSLKKFNQSLIYCRENNLDLAEIQLKKVVSSNPNLVKGQQLMALVYMQEKRYDLAMRCLRQANRVDAVNTQTIRYMRECRRHLRRNGTRMKPQDGPGGEDTITYESENDLIIRPVRLTDNSTVRTVVNLAIGAAVGIAFVFLLVVPEVKQRANANAAAQIVETDQFLTARDQTIEALQAEVDSLNQQILDAADASESAGARTQSYQSLLDAYLLYEEEEYSEAGETLIEVDRTMLEGDALDLYDSMQDVVELAMVEATYDRAWDLYSQRDYESAIAQFLTIAETQPDYREGEMAYYLAFCYNYADDYENALKWFYNTVEYATNQNLLNTAENMITNLEAEGYTAAD